MLHLTDVEIVSNSGGDGNRSLKRRFSMPIDQHQPQQTKVNPCHLDEGQLLPKLEQSNRDWLPGDLAMEA